MYPSLSNGASCTYFSVECLCDHGLYARVYVNDQAKQATDRRGFKDVS
jgi:hypothetical protein